MPYRLYDWECGKCGHVHEDLYWVDTGSKPPKEAELECPRCCKQSLHDRLMSCPAMYLYDRPWAPQVFGGKFDTMGNRRLPQLPPLPSDAAFDQVRDMYHSKDRQEKLKERQARVNENKVKRERAKAMQKDPNLDLRQCPLPGDPKRG